MEATSSGRVAACREGDMQLSWATTHGNTMDLRWLAGVGRLERINAAVVGWRATPRICGGWLVWGGGWLVVFERE
ncbi:hypothetical protein SESBI_37338 [Sesbania bispinosa]|nr:hypothetical protein SESBI_37338 [Sesbania bispinosa]